jgi:hypothetical protein
MNKHPLTLKDTQGGKNKKKRRMDWKETVPFCGLSTHTERSV